MEVISRVKVPEMANMEAPEAENPRGDGDGCSSLGSGGSSGSCRIADVVSQIFSWVLVPIFIPLYGLLAVLNLSILSFIPFGSKLVLCLIVGGITIVFPVVIGLLLKRAGVISEIGINNRKERFIPYMVTVLSLLGAAFFLYRHNAPGWVWLYFVGGAIGGVICSVVNFWWKISAHATGVGGLVALFLRIISDGMPMEGVYGWLIAAVVCAGALGSARVWLGKHTLLQVLAGYVVGFCCVFFVTML